MKLLPCVLSALVVQQADAKRKKRGKQYLTVSHNTAAETEMSAEDERLLTDCSLFFRDSQSTNADNTAGRITMTGDYAPLIGYDKCGWAVDAPKNCDIRFRVNKIHTEQFVNQNCDANDYFYIKWPGGRGRDKGVANSGRICSPETFEDAGQARCERDTPNPNCDMVHSFGKVGDWKSTNKDNIFVKFSSDGDGADSMHSTAFDLEWECEGSPDLDDNLGTCEVTDSVFGTVGWAIKDKKRYFANSGPGEELFPATNDLFPSYDAETETRDGCGAMCANTAGCYFWNWKKSTEQCSLTLGTKPGFKGIKKQTNQNYVGQSLSGSCGGDIKFGTSYQKSSKFYCKFQTPAQNAAFVEELAAGNEEITICPYDGMMTTTKILGITAETPRGEDDTQARYRWTKFTLATHIRVDPNKPALKEFCKAAPSVWNGDVAYFIKEKAENIKCGKHLTNISRETHSVSDMMKVENTDTSVFLSDTAQNCPSNCANIPGCSGFHWDGSNCHLAIGSIYNWGLPENENVEFTGRMTSGCQAVQPYQQSYTYNRSFSCKFSTGSGAVDFVNALLTASGNEASDANKGWQFCKTRSGIRMGRQLIVSGLDTDTSGGGRYRWLGFEVQQFIRMPKTLDTSYDQCDDSNEVRSHFGRVPMTENKKTSNVCAPGYAWRYAAHPDEAGSTSYWLRDLLPDARNTVDECPTHCANTAGCFSYTFYRNGGCSLYISNYRPGSKRNEIWRKRDKRVIQSGHIKRSCKNKELPFTTEYSRTSRFFCRFLTSERAEDLVVAIARENGISSATKFGEWNVSPPKNGESKTQWVDMYNLGDTDLSQYLPPPSRKLQRNDNRQWVGVEFYFTTFVRRAVADMAINLDDSDVQNAIQTQLILPEGTELDATSETLTTVDQLDSDGTGVAAGTNCNEDSGVFRCDCNDGFRWNEDTAECEAENPLDEEPEDELASVLSDDSSIEELQSLNLPEDTDLEETTPTEADLGTDTDGESSSTCSLNEDGTIGECSCNEGFEENDEGVCISTSPEVVDIDAAITAGLDDADFISAVQNTDFGATVAATTEVVSEIAILTADGEEGGSCTTPTNCTCNEGFAQNEDGDCVNENSLPPPTTTVEPVICEYEEVDVYQIIDDVFEKLSADVEEAGGNFEQADSHVTAFKRIHDRVGTMMGKGGRWAECTKSTENAITVALTNQGCGLGVTDIESMCSAFQVMYEYIFEDCDFDKARTTETNVRVRCENISNNLRQQDIGLDWL